MIAYAIKNQNICMYMSGQAFHGLFHLIIQTTCYPHFPDEIDEA